MTRFRLGALLAVLIAGAACGPGTGAPPTAATPGGAGPSATPTVPPLHPSVDDYPEALVALEGSGATHRLPVKVADTPERRSHGLMEVPSLPAGTGMVFLFDDARTAGFWMRNTHVPLSIAYANAQGTIVDILDMTPCPTPPPTGPCPSYPPDAPYRTALELPRSTFARLNITEGDRLTVTR